MEFYDAFESRNALEYLLDINKSNNSFNRKKMRVNKSSRMEAFPSESNIKFKHIDIDEPQIQ